MLSGRINNLIYVVWLPRKRIDFENIFPSCHIPLRTFPADPVGPKYSERSFVCINYLLRILFVACNCGYTRTVEHSHALAQRARARARISRYINLVKWAMHMLTPPESFRRIASCGGGVQCPLGITRSFYAYICISYAYAGGRTRNGTVATGRERPDINTCPSRSAFTAWVPVRPRVGVRPLTSLTGAYREIYRRRCHYERLWPGAR